MTSDELHKQAIEFIKKNKTLLIDTFANKAKYISEKKPVSIFMAGSPGAGKTEFTRNFLEITQMNAVHIDADEIKKIIPGYDGSNSSVIQGASSLGVEKLHDHVMKKKKSMVLDGTFAYYEKAKNNIERSLKKGRHIEIFYIYQDPLIAWDFTKKREKLEGRYVPKDLFVEAFFQAKDNVEKIKKDFANDVRLNVVIKNSLNHLKKLEINVASIDNYVKMGYTYESLMEKL